MTATIKQKALSLIFALISIFLAAAGIYELNQGETGFAIMLFLGVPCGAAMTWTTWRPWSPRVYYHPKPQQQRFPRASPGRMP